MNGTQRNLLMSSILVMALCFLAIQFYLGDHLKTARENASVAQSEVTAKKNRLKYIGDIKVPLKNLETSMSQVETIGLPKEESVPEILEQIEQLVLTQGSFGIVSFDPNLSKAAKTTTPTETPGGVTESSFTLSLTGNPDNLGSLFDAFNENIRPLAIKNLTITPIAGSSDVTIALSMVIYSTSKGSTDAGSVNTAPTGGTTTP